MHRLEVWKLLRGPVMSTALLLSLPLVWACGSSGNSAGQTAAVAQTAALSAGAASAAGFGDEDVTLSDRARRGLAISPVPLATSGLSRQKKELVGLGSYIVNAASDCAGCHTGPAGFLSGGNPFALDASHLVYSRNLTPDPTTGLPLSFEQFMQAVRTGKDFHPCKDLDPCETRELVVMPWTTLRWASDLDLAAIYAYLRTIPPVANAVPPDKKSDLPLPDSVPFAGHTYTDGVVVRPLTGATQSFDARRGLEVAPVEQPKRLRGEALESYGRGSYIANTLAHCNDCHTHPDRTSDQSHVNVVNYLTGGTVFTAPPPLQPVQGEVRATSANLKGVNFGFFNEPANSYARFRSIITTGTLTDETPPRRLAFPMSIVAANFSNLLESNLRDVYAYASGAPSTSGSSDVDHQPPARYCADASACAAGESCTADTHECVGGACQSDLDCGTCQTCGSGLCQAPAADSQCVATSQ